jgi:hypothetical protein
MVASLMRQVPRWFVSSLIIFIGGVIREWPHLAVISFQNRSVLIDLGDCFR